MVEDGSINTSVPTVPKRKPKCSQSREDFPKHLKPFSVSQMKRCIHIHVTMEQTTSLLSPSRRFQALNFRLIQVIFYLPLPFTTTQMVPKLKSKTIY